MRKDTGFAIQDHWEKLITYTDENILNNINKGVRQCYGDHLSRHLIDTEMKIIKLSEFHGPVTERIKMLREIDSCNHLTERLYILGYNLKVINDKRLEFLAKEITEIGKMIGGLLKSMEEKIERRSQMNDSGVNNI